MKKFLEFILMLTLLPALLLFFLINGWLMRNIEKHELLMDKEFEEWGERQW